MTTSDRTVADDVRSLMHFAPCHPGRQHAPVDSGVAGYWLCPLCGLQVRWPCPEDSVVHESPAERQLTDWSKR